MHLSRARTAAGWGAALALAMAAPLARAFPDAQVEVVTPPDFGWLLAPPFFGPPCRGGLRCGPPIPPRPCGPGPGCFGPRFGWLSRIVVNCDGWRPHQIERALALLRPGGTLVLITHGRSCTEPIYIFKSVQIVGVGGPAFWGPGGGAPPDPLPRAVLNAPPGLPCIDVAPGVRAVLIRGLVINAPAAQGAACIRADNADVEVRDTVIRYDGLSSAIYVAGGGLRLKNLGIAARTPAPAVAAQGTDVSFEDIRIAACQAGMLIEPGGGDSRLLRVFARSLDGLRRDEARPSTGLIVRGGVRSGRVEVTDTVLLGFSLGARFDHDVTADLRYGHIGFSRVAVLTEGDVGVRNMSLGASEVGVYVRSGRARILFNRIYGVRIAGIWADPGAKVWAAGNWVYPAGPNCGFMRDRAYNAAGQVCRPWAELPPDLRDPRYSGAFQDGWSEWNYNWGDPGGWQGGPGGGPGGGPEGGPGGDPGGADPGWGGGSPDYRGDFGYRGGYPSGGPGPGGVGPGGPQGDPPGDPPGGPAGPGDDPPGGPGPAGFQAGLPAGPAVGFQGGPFGGDLGGEAFSGGPAGGGGGPGDPIADGPRPGPRPPVAVVRPWPTYLPPYIESHPAPQTPANSIDYYDRR